MKKLLIIALAIFAVSCDKQEDIIPELSAAEVIAEEIGIYVEAVEGLDAEIGFIDLYNKGEVKNYSPNSKASKTTEEGCLTLYTSFTYQELYIFYIPNQCVYGMVNGDRFRSSGRRWFASWTNYVLSETNPFYDEIAAGVRFVDGEKIVSNLDSDGDGVIDIYDDLPNDPTATVDTDGDGCGDNSDDFINDDRYCLTFSSKLILQLMLSSLETTVSTFTVISGDLEIRDDKIDVGSRDYLYLGYLHPSTRYITTTGSGILQAEHYVGSLYDSATFTAQTVVSTLNVEENQTYWIEEGAGGQYEEGALFLGIAPEPRIPFDFSNNLTTEDQVRAFIFNRWHNDPFRGYDRIEGGRYNDLEGVDTVMFNDQKYYIDIHSSSTKTIYKHREDGDYNPRGARIEVSGVQPEIAYVYNSRDELVSAHTLVVVNGVLYGGVDFTLETFLNFTTLADHVTAEDFPNWNSELRAASQFNIGVGEWSNGDAIATIDYEIPDHLKGVEGVNANIYFFTQRDADELRYSTGISIFNGEIEGFLGCECESDPVVSESFTDYTATLRTVVRDIGGQLDRVRVVVQSNHNNHSDGSWFGHATIHEYSPSSAGEWANNNGVYSNPDYTTTFTIDFDPLFGTWGFISSDNPAIQGLFTTEQEAIDAGKAYVESL